MFSVGIHNTLSCSIISARFAAAAPVSKHAGKTVTSKGNNTKEDKIFPKANCEKYGHVMSCTVSVHLPDGIHLCSEKGEKKYVTPPTEIFRCEIKI